MTSVIWSPQSLRDVEISGLRLDLMTAKALVWVASVGRDADLTSEAHIYFFDRNMRLQPSAAGAIMPPRLKR